jgi:7,8-dihydro-6-hydroxymethylpterin-pyrophosphokinase
MEGPPPNLLWYIFLTVRCLSRTINSRSVLQLCQKLESEFTRKRSAQQHQKLYHIKVDVYNQRDETINTVQPTTQAQA